MTICTNKHCQKLFDADCIIFHAFYASTWLCPNCLKALQLSKHLRFHFISVSGMDHCRENGCVAITKAFEAYDKINAANIL